MSQQSAAQAAEPASVPVPDPAPAPATDDVDDPSAGSQEDTTPAISMPARKAKQGKPPGAATSTASTPHGTLEQVSRGNISFIIATITLNILASQNTT